MLLKNYLIYEWQIIALITDESLFAPHNIFIFIFLTRYFIECLYKFYLAYLQEGENNILKFDVDFHGPVIEDIKVDANESKRLLRNIKENTSKGPDGINPKLLSEYHNELAY